MKWPPPHRRAQLAKLAAILAAEVAMAPPMIALTFVLGRAPEGLLALQNRFRRCSLRWLHPEVAGDSS